MRLQASCAALAVALSTFAFAGAATAQEAEVAFNAAVASDYVFRGFSQTDEDPAFQAGVDLGVSNFYAGAWISNVDFGDDTSAEFDVYGGYRTEAAGFGLDLGVVGYLYFDEPSGADYNYVEYKAAVSRAVGPVSAGAVVYYSPDFFGADDEAVYYEANLAFAPADKFTISGAVGYQALDVSDDYTTWNAGVGYALNDVYTFDLRYHDTDVKGSDIAEARVVASIKAAF
ncbi:MAG: TorF family putative porin [Alphaproteobacteria bacterium]|nr:TorF family putative porin [Alphaproteobacteria bacterium]MBU2380722.1 TorF family putative porin [Alphaproteobacteria bacterium]